MTHGCSLGCGFSVAYDPTHIIVHGAHAHNLKNICFTFPKNKLVALTGPSGSGKSSIAVDILGNESVRQLLSGYGLVTDHIQKAAVDTIVGLAPAITISQRTTHCNPRSMVGTKTGILAILRNLFAAVAHQRCGNCGTDVKQPLSGKHTVTTITSEHPSSGCSDKKSKRSFFACPACGEQLEKLQMAHFSFNTALGFCDSCKGMGEVVKVALDRLFDDNKSIIAGGVRFWDEATSSYYARVIESASNYYAFSFDADLPIRSYTLEAKEFLMHGSTSERFRATKAPRKVSEGKFEGIVSYIMAQYKSNPEKAASAIKKYMVRESCSACGGTRLGRIGRSSQIGGKTIADIVTLNMSAFLEWLQNLEQHLAKDERSLFAAFKNGLIERASSLIEVGLHYLTLSRSLPSLSAGEAQRLRLAAALGSSSLSGVLYILDEPTTGLHPHDTARLLSTLRTIQKNNNTVLFIEHDFDVVRSADYVIDVGPGRGTQGGNIVATGTPAQIERCAQSITAKYLSKARVNSFENRIGSSCAVITVRGACENNLQNIDVSIPTQQLVMLAGVSGSGKSTFLFGILDKVARNYLNSANEVPGKHEAVEGLDTINRIVTVNQSTIGSKSSRSNVATYTKLFDVIRDLFAAEPEAKRHRYTAGSFSFNASDERCKNCDGAGVVPIDMSFMPEVEMECPVCGGLRFNEELLSVKFRGHTIAGVLALTVLQAMEVFNQQKKVVEILDIMKRVGLEHVTLGQSTSTLSGGEAQRIKLASELCKSGKEKTLFLLDEPTTGLHPEEVEKLLSILRELVSKGNTVVAIEHNVDALFAADTIIDFGPGGGPAGGTIVAQGTPQEVAANKHSLTGQVLKKSLGIMER